MYNWYRGEAVTEVITGTEIKSGTVVITGTAVKNGTEVITGTEVRPTQK